VSEKVREQGEGRERRRTRDGMERSVRSYYITAESDESSIHATPLMNKCYYSDYHIVACSCVMLALESVDVATTDKRTNRQTDGRTDILSEQTAFI